MMNVTTVTDEGYKSVSFSMGECALIQDSLVHTIEMNSNYNDDAKDKDLAEYIEKMRSILAKIEKMSEENKNYE
jgi:hypothetical protein